MAFLGTFYEKSRHAIYTQLIIRLYKAITAIP